MGRRKREGREGEAGRRAGGAGGWVGIDMEVSGTELLCLQLCLPRQAAQRGPGSWGAEKAARGAPSGPAAANSAGKMTFGQTEGRRPAVFQANLMFLNSMKSQPQEVQLLSC